MANGAQTLLVVWTGADWLWLKPLLDAGELPALARLVEHGASGSVRGFAPHAPEMLAASLATGLPPDRHGVFGQHLREDGRRVALGLSARRGRALWEDFAAAGRQVGVVGWPGTFPVETVPGAWVADAWANGLTRTSDAMADAPRDAVHPAAAAEWLAELRIGVRDLEPGLLGLLVPEWRERGRADDPRAGHLAAHLARLYTLHNASVAVLGRERPEFFTVYHGFLGAVAREFGGYHPPRHAEAKTADYTLYREVLRGAARLQDLLLGDLLAHAEPGARVLLVSPWGWATGDARPRHGPTHPEVGEAWGARPGLWVASGPGAPNGRVLPGASVLDVAPTLLAWCGLPVPDDRPGRVMTELWHDAAPLPAPARELRPTHPVDAPDFSREPDALSADNAWALGRALRDLGRPADAVAWLQWAWLAEPEDAARASELAQTLLQLARADEAEAPIAAVLDRGRDTAAARFLRAWRAGVRGEWAEAESTVAELGGSPLGRTLRAELCLRTARAGEAREIWREQTRREPGHLRAWIGIAQAALALGESDEAAEALARARALAPGARELAHLETRLHASKQTRRSAPDAWPMDWSGRLAAAAARADAAEADHARTEMFFAARKARRGAAADDSCAHGEWRVREPAADEFARLSRHFAHGARAQKETVWCRVLVAGREERIVGLIELSASSGSPTPEPEGARTSASGRLAIVQEMRSGWDNTEAARALFEAAWVETQARGANEVGLSGLPGEAARERARALGFASVLRKELRRMPIADGLAWMEGPGARVVGSVGLPIFTLDRAEPARVRELCRATGLLGEERIHEQLPGRTAGYDPGLSFFAGTAEAPLAVLLAREQEGGAYLELLARDAARPDGHRAVGVALYHALLRAAQKRGHQAIYTEVTPARNRGLRQLTDRWRSEVVAVSETWLWRRPLPDCDGKAGPR